MDTVRRVYHVVFYERADPRVKDWFLMTSPVPITSLIVTYLMFVKLVLPVYMRHRKPYQLRTIIKWYNVLQILANAVVSWGVLTSGWTTHYHFGCMLPDYSMDPLAVRMLSYMWGLVVIKVVEFVETAFFVLRKRDRQASFLHVYHHVTTLIITWAGVKYVGGGITSFSVMLNAAIHVLMYTYYLFSAEGSPGVKAFLNKYKKWLTVVQMVQFTTMLIYSSQVFLPSCNAPTGITYLYFPNVIFIYYMFYDFYKKNYLKKNEQNGVQKIK
ncbi:very long chain fatty acid elongase 7-like [Anticarsia gemmatalis]|uniref:very long chain fatty acid elongase 7-like n=1 Tax=Anticarsia gemmatalis TaxID=129554 RepID=UPI003F760C23